MINKEEQYLDDYHQAMVTIAEFLRNADWSSDVDDLVDWWEMTTGILYDNLWNTTSEDILEAIR